MLMTCELEAVSLKDQLVSVTNLKPKPLAYHERTGRSFPKTSSVLQQNILRVEKHTKQNLMKINETKSNVMIFNFSRNYDFPPEFSFEDNQILECLNQSKLLGIHIRSDLKWSSNTESIYKKAMSKMWLIRRMKLLKLDSSLILDYYLKEIRPVTEFGVIVWNSGLTKYQVGHLEKIQKVALLIILGPDYKTYEHALTKVDLLRLSERREQLCINFAVKLFKSTRRDDFFNLAKPTISLRNKGRIVHEILSRAQKCYLAPHNYIARLINQNLT